MHSVLPLKLGVTVVHTPMDGFIMDDIELSYLTTYMADESL